MRQSFRTLILTVLLATAFVATGHAQDAGAKAVDVAWLKAMKANDLDAIMRCYAPDAVAWLPGAPMARGEKAIRATYEGLLSANTVQDVAISEAEYKTAGDFSAGWGKFALTLVPKASGSPVTMTGRFTEIAEQRGGRWVYIVDHASADPTPAEAAK